MILLNHLMVAVKRLSLAVHFQFGLHLQGLVAVSNLPRHWEWMIDTSLVKYLSLPYQINLSELRCCFNCFGRFRLLFHLYCCQQRSCYHSFHQFVSLHQLEHFFSKVTRMEWIESTKDESAEYTGLLLPYLHIYQLYWLSAILWYSLQQISFHLESHYP